MAKAVVYQSMVEDERLSLMPNRYDACLCDPPYGLEFMGRGWDAGVPPAKLWKKVYATLKPGAYLLAFGGTRTHHRLMCAIEDAGFEIRDCLMWLYGTGFPKGADLSKLVDKRKGAKRETIRHPARAATSGAISGKAETRPWIERARKQGFYEAAGNVAATAEAARWSGYGTTLKPAWEPIIMAQKPPEGGTIDAAQDYRVGGLNIAAARIGADGGCKSVAAYAGKRDVANCYRQGLNSQRSPEVEGLGRWPANVLLDEDAAAQLDAVSGQTKSRTAKTERPGPNYKNKVYGRGKGGHITQANTHTDEGGASRFFWVAKVGPAERGDCKHETMKPLRLCEYLARLILPPAIEGATRRLLVPFSGSGSEMIGGYRAGFDEVAGIEQSEDYILMAHPRLEAEFGEGNVSWIEPTQ